MALEHDKHQSTLQINQTPVYPPFFHSVMEHERELLKNPLKLMDDGTYTFDIEDLKSKIDERTKLLLLCSPHNPVGRVWRREELEHILKISPYNTYRNHGLPPGPIRVASPNGIDAVLNYVQHKYIFMCAKETLNGEHNSAVSYAEHQANAKKYQKALDDRKIFK